MYKFDYDNKTEEGTEQRNNISLSKQSTQSVDEHLKQHIHTHTIYTFEMGCSHFDNLRFKRKSFEYEKRLQMNIQVGEWPIVFVSVCVYMSSGATKAHTFLFPIYG